MSISTDLYGLATSGLRAQRELLQTAGNNVANINTEGYTRQRTEHDAFALGGVGKSTTSRVIDNFAQGQLRRDTSALAEHQAYANRIASLDNLVAADGTNLSNTISGFFSALQSSSDLPANITSRSVVLDQAETVVNQMQYLEDFYTERTKQVNSELNSLVEQANEHIKTISDINTKISAMQSNTKSNMSVLIDKRDKAVIELAKLVELDTYDAGNGRTAINLRSGQSLVLADGSFSVFDSQSKPDLQRSIYTLISNQESGDIGHQIPLGQASFGGAIGGLVDFRDNALGVAHRQLGQMSLAFTDNINRQNRLGMDYDSQLGGDLFSHQGFTALEYPDYQSTGQVTAALIPGQASRLAEGDYRIEFGAADSATNTLPVTIAILNTDGSVMKNENGDPQQEIITVSLPVTGEGSTVQGSNGIAFTLTGTIDDYSEGDKLMFQPSKQGASSLSMATTRAEDIALASPLRVRTSDANSRSAILDTITVTNTRVTGDDNQRSAFTSDHNIQAAGQVPGINNATNPGFADVSAPSVIVFTAADEFQLQDGNGNVLSTVSNVTSLQNLIQQAKDNGTPNSTEFTAMIAYDDYPGYDISLKGNAEAGDTFTMEFNTGGVKDNANALLLDQIQSGQTVRLRANDPSQPQNTMSIQEAYANMVSEIGQKTANNDVNLETAKVMHNQSEQWMQSVSGVNLDEEASNLIRFQQAYAASARVLSTAQTLFDSILAAAR